MLIAETDGTVILHPKASVDCLGLPWRRLMIQLQLFLDGYLKIHYLTVDLLELIVALNTAILKRQTQTNPDIYEWIHTICYV